MKVSYQWLQTYFEQPLPSPEEIADALTFHVFEIEGIEKKGDDTILDVKVLPDRACYALSHQGIAYEISAILKMPLKKRESTKDYLPSQVLELDIRDDRCVRDSKMILKNIEISPSPAWLKERLEILGQRSINNVVDATNYVMLDMGQPLHAFDFDKLTAKEGKVKIVLKKARKDESITLLGGKTITLDEDTLIFADAYNNNLPLDIAGVKGGVAAEVDEATKNIIVLAANFDATYIRKAATKLGIRTDAAKRSENRLPPELTVRGLSDVSDIILGVAGSSARVEGIVDYYPHPKKEVSFVCNPSILSSMLGVSLASDEVESIFDRLNIKWENSGGSYKLTPPFYRLDLVCSQDIVEEVGRINGYDKLPAKIPSPLALSSDQQGHFESIQSIKHLLADDGFYEVFTYSLTPDGDREIEKSVASDKNFLRTNLSKGISKALELNAHHAALLELDKICIFEIGNVFTKNGEHTSLAIGIKHIRKIKGQSANEDIRQTRERLLMALGAQVQTVCTVDDTGGLLLLKDVLGKARQIGVINNIDGIMELNLDALIPHIQLAAYSRPVPTQKVIYRSFSQYPFIVRDIAVFVPDSVKSEEIEKIITENGTELLLRYKLFDTFQKEGKTSYAFRMIFQSFERTLTDDEINATMAVIAEKIKGKGWEVR